MSSHHTRKAINLHHDQVDAARQRKLERQAGRVMVYRAKTNEAKRRHNIALIFGFGWFAYMMIATAVYLWYVVGA